MQTHLNAQAKLADPLIDSKAMETFRDMSDQKVVQNMAEHHPIGIGFQLVDLLARFDGRLRDIGAVERGQQRDRVLHPFSGPPGQAGAR